MRPLEICRWFLAERLLTACRANYWQILRGRRQRRSVTSQRLTALLAGVGMYRDSSDGSYGRKLAAQTLPGPLFVLVEVRWNTLFITSAR